MFSKTAPPDIQKTNEQVPLPQAPNLTKSQCHLRSRSPKQTRTRTSCRGHMIHLRHRQTAAAYPNVLLPLWSCGSPNQRPHQKADVYPQTKARFFRTVFCVQRKCPCLGVTKAVAVPWRNHCHQQNDIVPNLRRNQVFQGRVQLNRTNSCLHQKQTEEPFHSFRKSPRTDGVRSSNRSLSRLKINVASEDDPSKGWKKAR